MRSRYYAAAFAGLCLAGALVASQAASAFTITIQTPPPDSYTRAFAYDGTNLDNDYYYPSALPDSGSHTATVGGSIATNEYDLSNAGFEITFDHTRVAALNSQGYTVASIFFRSDEDVDYTLEGSYGAVDSDGRRIYLSVQLLDSTGGENLFINSQQSLGTVDENFILGDTGGDDSNILIGSLSGTLTGGHLHEFQIEAAIISQPTVAAATATAGGYVKLTLTPEPTTGLLLACGLAGLTVVGRQRSLP